MHKDNKKLQDKIDALQKQLANAGAVVNKASVIEDAVIELLDSPTPTRGKHCLRVRLQKCNSVNLVSRTKSYCSPPFQIKRAVPQLSAK